MATQEERSRKCEEMLESVRKPCPDCGSKKREWLRSTGVGGHDYSRCTNCGAEIKTPYFNTATMPTR